jgi:hypothetical protein
MGYDIAVDGVAGPGTRATLDAFYRDAGIVRRPRGVDGDAAFIW